MHWKLAFILIVSTHLSLVSSSYITHLRPPEFSMAMFVSKRVIYFLASASSSSFSVTMAVPIRKILSIIKFMENVRKTYPGFEINFKDTIRKFRKIQKLCEVLELSTRIKNINFFSFWKLTKFDASLFEIALSHAILP